MVTFRYRLKELIEEKRGPRYSERQFAEEVKVRQPTINAMCRSDAPAPKLEVLAKICDALDCTIADLLVMERAPQRTEKDA